jgi:Family of unknown function (DUF5908)
MPVIINEIQITALVNNQAAKAPSGGGAAASSPVNTEKIVKSCVEEVLRILKEKQER